jgi:hypothetical protein
MHDLVAVVIRDADNVLDAYDELFRLMEPFTYDVEHPGTDGPLTRTDGWGLGSRPGHWLLKPGAVVGLVPDGARVGAPAHAIADSSCTAMLGVFSITEDDPTLILQSRADLARKGDIDLVATRAREDATWDELMREGHLTLTSDHPMPPSALVIDGEWDERRPMPGDTEENWQDWQRGARHRIDWLPEDAWLAVIDVHR